MHQEYLDNPVLLDQIITSLSMEIHTVDASHAATSDKVYCNVVFKDSSLLFNPKNFRLDTSGHNDFERGETDTYPLPIPESLEKKIADIDEFYIRKSGGNGWMLGSALLFANNIELPVIGNNQINQFLDNNKKVLFLRDWSTRSLCSSSDVSAKYPLLFPQYRIAGPVLGQVSDTSAKVLYRVDREGEYRLRVFEVAAGQLVFNEVQTLSPTATFHVKRLQPNTHYVFSFFHVYLGQDFPQPDGDGEFRTFPAEGSGVKFSFAFGSCSRNKDNVAQNAWTGIKNLGADPSVDPATDPLNNLRYFIHLGDTFYFYDDVQHGDEPKNLRTVLAANLSARRHPRFLEMAGRIPCCAVWDDHDFRNDNADSHEFAAKGESLKGFLDYWGNNPIDSTRFGLTTRLTFGNVDIYLIDGRFLRDNSSICFGQGQLIEIVKTIIARGASKDRLVILASGSTWNHTNKEGDAYGNDRFDMEREAFYQQLNPLIGTSINGLVFLSGDIHQNEIHEIVLASGDGGPSKRAPEFVSSPLGNNSLNKAQEIEGERKWSVPSKGEDPAKRGFATLEIDTTSREPDGGWKIKVRYYHANASITASYDSKEYTLSGGQFIFEP